NPPTPSAGEPFHSKIPCRTPINPPKNRGESRGRDPPHLPAPSNRGRTNGRRGGSRPSSTSGGRWSEPRRRRGLRCVGGGGGGAGENRGGRR
ncbi:hypothetical protein BAE44_0004295, partial [Dichanthelium oligosanthes]